MEKALNNFRYQVDSLKRNTIGGNAEEAEEENSRIASLKQLRVIANNTEDQEVCRICREVDSWLKNQCEFQEATYKEKLERDEYEEAYKHLQGFRKCNDYAKLWMSKDELMFAKKLDSI